MFEINIEHYIYSANSVKYNSLSISIPQGLFKWQEKLLFKIICNILYKIHNLGQ